MDHMPLKLKLSQGERLSPLWLKLRDHLITRLDDLRLRNDGMMDESKRCQLVGRIHEVKGLLSIGVDGPDAP